MNMTAGYGIQAQSWKYSTEFDSTAKETFEISLASEVTGDIDSLKIKSTFLEGRVALLEYELSRLREQIRLLTQMYYHE